MDEWVPAEAAIARLGIARASLYAYVSRGLIRARPDPTRPNRSVYSAVDLAALATRRPRSRLAVAAEAIDFGTPVLTSAITAIANGQLLYRGRDAVRLAETATLEQTAALLWSAPVWPDPPRFTPSSSTLPPLEAALTALASAHGPAIWRRPAAALHTDGAALLLRIAAAYAGTTRNAPLHVMLASAWGATAPAEDLIRRALVLCADHELNASTFAVRVVASTGAALAHCLMAGLAALAGPLHGGTTARVRAALADPALLADPAEGLARRLDRGESLPGFGHRLYPNGDPRAASLLDALAPGRWWRELIAATEAQTGERPNIDFALVALERECRLPDGAAFAIFALGRTAGWIAHALEQNAEGRLIRPRARPGRPDYPTAARNSAQRSSSGST